MRIVTKVLSELKGRPILKQVVKNYSYDLTATIISRICAFLFTIILARSLTPEYFGLYSLALSVVMAFAIFADLGIGGTAVRFISRELGRGDKKKAAAYRVYLQRMKFFLVAFAFLLMIVLAVPLTKFFSKPAILPLLVFGAIYLIFMSLNSFLGSLLTSLNNFKWKTIASAGFELSRVVLAFTVLFVLLNNIGPRTRSLFVFPILIFSVIVSLSIATSKVVKSTLFTYNKVKLTETERREVYRYIIFLTATSLSFLFFSYIDMIMLGRFVSGEMLGYYRAAFTLLNTAAVFFSFSGALFPVLSRLEKQKMQITVKKISKLVAPLVVLAALGLALLSKVAVMISYGNAYMLAAPLLSFISVLIIINVYSSLYTTFINSAGKPEITARATFYSAIANVVLNFVLIITFVKISEFAALFGAATATILSRVFYLVLVSRIRVC